MTIKIIGLSAKAIERVNYYIGDSWLKTCTPNDAPDLYDAILSEHTIVKVNSDKIWIDTIYGDEDIAAEEFVSLEVI